MSAITRTPRCLADYLSTLEALQCTSHPRTTVLRDRSYLLLFIASLLCSVLFGLLLG
jgi:hypothetical protein